MLYDILKFIHIMSAITAVGSNITYGIWSVRAAHEPAHAPFVLRGIKFIDDRIANPAYGMILVTGLLMLVVGRKSITSLWIIVALVLFVAVAVIGFAFFSPLLKRQISLADSGETSSEEYQRLARRSRMIGPILGLVVVVIVIMMVFQPTL
jgi:uncharacterized membrane protein